jgi:hypothetical protein
MKSAWQQVESQQWRNPIVEEIYDLISAPLRKDNRQISEGSVWFATASTLAMPVKFATLPVDTKRG